MLIDINKIVVKDRIRKDFGDIEELAQDIKENGLINPPVVTPDYNLIAGERRLRAMKHLGWKQIEVRVMTVDSAEQALNLEISENEVRKDFSKAERIDYARRLERIESAKAEKRNEATRFGGGGNISTATGKTRDTVAQKMGIGSGKQYEKEKSIVDNKNFLSTEDFENWDEGKLSTNKAYQKVKAELQAQKELNEKYSALSPEIKTLIEEKNKEGVQSTTILGIVKNLLSTEEQRKLTKIIVGDKKYTQEDMDEIARSKVKVEEKIVEVDKPETLNRVNELEKKLKETNEKNQNLVKQISEQNEIVGGVLETMDHKLISDCTKNSVKMSEFLKEMALYDYMAESLKDIPESVMKEYKRNVIGINRWSNNILKVIDENSDVVDADFDNADEEDDRFDETFSEGYYRIEKFTLD